VIPVKEKKDTTRLPSRLMWWLFCVAAGMNCATFAAQPPKTSELRESAAVAALQPPSGKWLTDDDGNQYYLEQLPRSQARRMPDGSVKTIWGIPIQIEREDEQYFYYKIFRPKPAVKSGNPGLTAEERARIKSSYRVKLPASARLKFESFGKGLPERGQWRDGFVIADMNGDGHPDIVHGPARKQPGPPVILLGDGRGSWRRWQDAHFPAQTYDYGDVAVGDFNGDTIPDIAMAMHLQGFAALLGDGKGGFHDASRGLDRPPADREAGTARSPGFSSRALSAVDWDRNEQMDLLTFGEGPRLPTAGGGARGLVLYRGQSNGIWQRYDQGTGTDHNYGHALAIGDFNADGRPDCVTGSATMGAKDILHLGTLDGGWTDVHVSEARPMALVRAVAAADFNGDGRDDVVLAYASYELETWRYGVDVLNSRADGQWQRNALFAADGDTGIYALAAGDLDGDGYRDVVGLDGDGQTLIFLGKGGGAFSRERSSIAAFAGGCRGVHVVLADLDDDGRDEIVASFAEEQDAMSPGGCTTGGGITAWKTTGSPARQ
jgi:hypothetical protein